MPRKTNGYISTTEANFYASKQVYFQRVFPANGGYFITNNGTKKVNEKTFKIIQPNLKPRL